MTEELDLARLVCAIVETVGGAVELSYDQYDSATPIEVVKSDNGYVFLTSKEENDDV